MNLSTNVFCFKPVLLLRDVFNYNSMSDKDKDGSGILNKYINSQNTVVGWIIDILIALIIVIAISSMLYMYAGAWPPFINIGSGSMEPNIQTGDVVLVVDKDRPLDDEVPHKHGIITKYAVEDAENEYNSFGSSGDVIVYRIDGFPIRIIHRAHFYVEEGEDWYDRANPEYLESNSCEEQEYCPAPHDGFITKGDANPLYDVENNMAPIPPEDIHSKAEYKVFPFW